jgi:ketosteroid isomerase-like protein
MDLNGVMSMYAPDIVSFDIEPPLQHLGADAKGKNSSRVFAMYQRPLGYEIRNLAIIVGDNVAFGQRLNRISGTLKNGNRNDA